MFRRATAFVVLVLGLIPIGAQAAPPERLTIPFNSSTLSRKCGFPLVRTFSGSMELQFHAENGSGVLRTIRQVRGEERIWNPATGASLTGRSIRVQNLKENVEPPVLHPDGSVSYHDSFVGMDNHLVVPGHGALIVDAGIRDVYYTLAADGTFLGYDAIVIVAGNFDPPMTLCELLG